MQRNRKFWHFKYISNDFPTTLHGRRIDLSSNNSQMTILGQLRNANVNKGESYILRTIENKEKESGENEVLEKPEKLRKKKRKQVEEPDGRSSGVGGKRCPRGMESEYSPIRYTVKRPRCPPKRVNLKSTKRELLCNTTHPEQYRHKESGDPTKTSQKHSILTIVKFLQKNVVA